MNEPEIGTRLSILVFENNIEGKNVVELVNSKMQERERNCTKVNS